MYNVRLCSAAGHGVRDLFAGLSPPVIIMIIIIIMIKKKIIIIIIIQLIIIYKYS